MFNCGKSTNGNIWKTYRQHLSETEPLLVSDVLLFNSTEMQTDVVAKDGNGNTASNSTNAGVLVTT